jgi:transcription initiation factor TFIIIB Brf1 subunit/transcription initiation factor TFIIB
MTTVQPTTVARQIIRIAAVNDGIVTRKEEGVAAAAVLVPSIPQKKSLLIRNTQSY